MDLEDRITVLVNTLANFGEGTLECPEILTLDGKVDADRLIEVLQIVQAKCTDEIDDKRDLIFHPLEEGHLYFHRRGVKHVAT